MMMDSEEEEEQTALVCDNGKFRVKFRSKMTMVKKKSIRSKITNLVHNSDIRSKQVNFGIE